MIAYGLTKNMSSHIHSHDKCDVCNSEITKKKGRGSARMKKRNLLRTLKSSW